MASSAIEPALDALPTAAAKELVADGSQIDALDTAGAWVDGTAVATSDNPYGGVVAANRVVQTVLDDLSAFCADAVRSVRMEKSVAPK